MKRTCSLVVAIGLLLTCSPMKSQTQTTNAAVSAARLKWKITRAAEIQYLFYLPKNYNPKSRQRWPLILFLHGAGERGTNVQRVAVHGPLKMATQGKDFPFIIVAPLCPTDELWENEPLLKLLEHVEKKFAVDRNRVYLTGLSMGGYGTWRLGLAHPEKFAALVPICGGGQLIDVLLAGYGKKVNPLKALPVWAFHGAKDPVVPLEESERMIGALKKAGATETTLTVYPDAGHDSWTATYNNPEVYDWLLKHELPR